MTVFESWKSNIGKVKLPVSDHDEGSAMKLHETNHRATTQVTNVLRFAAWFVILVLLILATLWQPASAQPGARSAEMVVKLNSERGMQRASSQHHRSLDDRAYPH